MEHQMLNFGEKVIKSTDRRTTSKSKMNNSFPIVYIAKAQKFQKRKDNS